jgi:hypothetical protein
LVHQNLILLFFEVDFGLRRFSKKSLHTSFHRLISLHVICNHAVSGPKPAACRSGFITQQPTIQCRIPISNSYSPDPAGRHGYRPLTG